LLLFFLASTDILAGQIQQFTDDSDRASDVLFELRERIPDEEAVWLTSVDNALANMFLRQSRWRLALGSYDRILELIPAATKQYVESNYPSVNDREELEQFMAEAHRCEILSRQGRTLLQIGALPQVANAFEAATEVWNSIASRIPPELANHRLVKMLPVQMAMNEGLFDFSKSNYDRAMVPLSKAVELLRSDGLPALKYEVEDWMGPTVAGSETPTIVYTECTNNMALCYLYTCRMKDAVETLEGSIRDDAGSFLTERTVFNLCTLYELGADSATSAKRKRVLQLIAKRFFLHDVGPESFRVT
jgi:tetratricopeptide (TPR) repeat protein